MKLKTRHVAMVSFIAASVSFIYVLGFSKLEDRSPRFAENANRAPSAGNLIGSIRRELISGQLESAARIVGQYRELYPDDPYSRFYSAIIAKRAGNQEAETAHWAMIYTSMNSGNPLPSRLTRHQVRYLNAWATRGVGQIEESQQLFIELAKDIEDDTIDLDGQLWMPGVAYNLACYYTMGGKIERALTLWDRAVELGYVDTLGWWMVDPDLVPLHSDHRFWESGERLNEREG